MSIVIFPSVGDFSSTTVVAALLRSENVFASTRLETFHLSSRYAIDRFEISINHLSGRASLTFGFLYTLIGAMGHKLQASSIKAKIASLSSLHCRPTQTKFFHDFIVTNFKKERPCAKATNCRCVLWSDELFMFHSTYVHELVYFRQKNALLRHTYKEKLQARF